MRKTKAVPGQELKFASDEARNWLFARLGLDAPDATTKLTMVQNEPCAICANALSCASPGEARHAGADLRLFRLTAVSGRLAASGTFDRTAYQCELMRKRRAAEKAKGELK